MKVLNEQAKVHGKPIVMNLKTKKGGRVIAFGYDLGYTKKLLAFGNDNVAELLANSIYEVALDFEEWSNRLEKENKGNDVLYLV